MRRSLLFVFPLVLFLVLPARAQQTSDARDRLRIRPMPADTETLTPRQAAEMRADILMARKEFLDAVRAYDDDSEESSRTTPELLNKMGVAYQQLTDLEPG